MKIKIVKDGPYIVSGGVPLKEKIIRADGRAYVYKEGRELPQSEQYSLCRCGKSANAPFCDGAHIHSGFRGAETADRRPFAERASKRRGEAVNLLDDGRCAYARFCHRQGGNIWELVDDSDNPVNKKEAIIAASECPSGRLVVTDKDGNSLNIRYEPEIEILQDPQYGVSGPLAVKGSIPLESADGTLYEERERYALCRCGRSTEKPFCDAMHVNAGYRDKKKN